MLNHCPLSCHFQTYITLLIPIQGVIYAKNHLMVATRANTSTINSNSSNKIPPTSPFDNQQQAEALWSELNCQLWFLTAEDEQPEDEASRNQLTHAVSYPEWEELIGEEYILTLTIICDDGQGLYLLFHKDLSLEKFQEKM